MKITHKLMFGFVGLALLIAALEYVCLQSSQKALANSIGESSEAIAAQTLDKIQRNIYNRTENIQTHATNPLIRKFTAGSNIPFENISDPNGYIQEVEKLWAREGNELTPLIEQLATNELSRWLITLQNFYGTKYNYPLFAEIFVTNKFGVNVAQTNKTSDYYQADELWWQSAKKDGLFVSDVNYDDSTGAFSTEIAVKINDEMGNFIGVIKAVLNINETIEIIKKAKTDTEYKTMQLYLLNGERKIIYSTSPYDFHQDAHYKLTPLLGTSDYQNHKNYFIGQKNGRDKETLFAHAHSRNYRDFDGLGWILLTETKTSEVFAPIALLRRTMLLSWVIITGLALLASTATYRSIIVPIGELQRATVQIAAGNLDTNLTEIGTGEIGFLARSFQKMAQQLKKTIAELNDEIAEHKKSGYQLKESRRFLDSIFDGIQDGISVLDVDLNIIKVNKWMEKMYADNMPLVGNKCYKVYHNRNSPCPSCPSLLALESGKAHTSMVPYVLNEQEKGMFELSAFPLINIDGKITGVIDHVKNVTEHRKAEQNLRRSEQRFREVVENAKECVWETDIDGLYIYASPVIKEILGYKPNELVGKKYYYDMLHFDDRDKVKIAFGDLLEKKQPFQKLINRNLHKNGHVVWLSTSAMPIVDEQGNVTGYRGVDADITEQRKAEAILSERAEQVMHHHNTLLKLANMPEQDLDSLLRITAEQDAEVLNIERVSVWFFDGDKTDMVCREQYDRTKKTHKNGESLKARNYPRYFNSLETSRIIATNNAPYDPRTCEFADTYLLKNNITSMIDVPIRLHGQIVGIICHEHIGPAREWTSTEQDFAASIADMISLKLEASERTKAEKTLEKLNRDLELTIQELSQSNRQLQDFVHIAAHDLKTPVRGIGTLADWIISDYGEKLDEHGKENIRLLKARVVRIDKLIDGMLHFSKIARSRQNEGEINLNILVSEIAKKINPPDNIEIATDSLPTVICEHAHISQVIEELLSNAVSFIDKPEGLIKVGCVEQGDFWKFYVSDNGPGIEQKYFDRIFKIFQTLPKKEESDTAGVGLAIARKIVEIYGGKIWVESQPDKGSTFFFTFPKATASEKYTENIFAGNNTQKKLNHES